MGFACFSDRVTAAMNTFQENEKGIVYGVARLGEMRRNRNRAVVVVWERAAMFSKALVELAVGFLNGLLFFACF